MVALRSDHDVVPVVQLEELFELIVGNQGVEELLRSVCFPHSLFAAEAKTPFSGKATLERSLRESGLSHAILRPAVLFGKEDILVNNIAWMLRRFPVFGVFGRGEYRLQPIHVDDLARLAVEEGKSRRDSRIDAIGPETFAYRDLVATIGRIIGKPRPSLAQS